MNEPKPCNLMLVTQDKCEVCESLKKELPEEDIGIEVVNLSEDERAYDLSMKFGIEKVPMVVCDCGDEDFDTMRGEKSIRQFIQSLL